MAKRFLYILTIFFIYLLLSGTVSAEEDTGTELETASEALKPSLRRNIEWFGMNIGVGGHFLDPSLLDKSATDFIPEFKADLLFFNLHFPYFFLTALEFHPTAFIGSLGLGIRPGIRIPLTADYRHELRVGSFIGVDIISAGLVTLSFEPTAQYVYNSDVGSVGFGLGAPLKWRVEDIMASHYERDSEYPELISGFTFYIRWSIGRKNLPE